MLKLRVVSPAALVREFDLPPGIELRIGRREDCEVRVVHHSVGRMAAALRVDGDRALIRDLGSTGGTWIHRPDGQRDRAGSEWSSLVPGARFFVGVVELVLTTRE